MAKPRTAQILGMVAASPFSSSTLPFSATPNNNGIIAIPSTCRELQQLKEIPLISETNPVAEANGHHCVSFINENLQGPAEWLLA